MASNIPSLPQGDDREQPGSPSVGPLTPDVDDRNTQLGSSPSFDYHQERRLHLKDEIWLSHHLPRIPPNSTTVTNTPTQSHSRAPSHTQHLDGDAMRRATPSSIMTTGEPMRDPSPSAFHPKDKQAPPPLSLEDGKGKNLQRGGAGMSMDDTHENDMDGEKDFDRKSEPEVPSDLLSPAPFGDLDPAATMIHRRELDDQERLDLEAEERERQIGGTLDEFGKLGLDGSQRESAGAQPQPGPSQQGEFAALMFRWLSASTSFEAPITRSFHIPAGMTPPFMLLPTCTAGRGQLRVRPIYSKRQSDKTLSVLEQSKSFHQSSPPSMARYRYICGTTELSPFSLLLV